MGERVGALPTAPDLTLNVAKAAYLLANYALLAVGVLKHVNDDL